MKILMVTMSMNIGGAETHILELIRALISMGDDVTLASNGGVYADMAQSYGARHVKLPLNTKNPISVIKSYKGLKKLILEEQFDIVHAHARIPAFICGMLWDRVTLEGGRRFRFVTTAHLNFSVNPLWRKIARWGEEVMAVSDDIEDYLVSEYGYRRERIHLTINGIDTEKFSEKTDISSVLSQHNLDVSRRRIVYMSRLDADRADVAFRLLDIAPRIGKDYPDVDIVIVGGGGEIEKIKSIAKKINRSADRTLVTVTGGVSNTNEYCAAADIFIGVSRSALEAMSSSKTVIIAGNQGALGIFDETKEKIARDTNFCCRGCDIEDGDSLYQDIKTLLDASRETLDGMGRYNREFILRYYTAERMAMDYREMYSSVITSPTPFDHRRGAPDIVISGYYGFGNLGDESLLDIITHSVAETVPGVRLAALTRHPHADRARTGLYCISRFNMLSVMYNLKRAKLLISGGGSLLQDTTSRRNLVYYAGVIRIAEKLGTKVCVLANGIGPVKYESNRRLAKKVIQAADRVSVRDADSRAVLLGLGVDDGECEIHITSDPAFLIKPLGADALGKVTDRLGLGGKKYFTLSPRPLTITRSRKNKQYTYSEDDIRLAAALASSAVKIARKYSLTPVVIPMQERYDGGICSVICDMIKSELNEGILYTPESAPEMIGVLGGAEFMIGIRLHSIIFASSAEIPVIGLSYDPKVRSMMKQLGQKYSVDLTDGTGDLAPCLIEYVGEIMQNHGEISRELSEKSEYMRSLCRLDLDAVKELLG